MKCLMLPARPRTSTLSFSLNCTQLGTLPTISASPFRPGVTFNCNHTGISSFAQLHSKQLMQSASQMLGLPTPSMINARPDQAAPCHVRKQHADASPTFEVFGNISEPKLTPSFLKSCLGLAPKHKLSVA